MMRSLEPKVSHQRLVFWSTNKFGLMALYSEFHTVEITGAALALHVAGNPEWLEATFIFVILIFNGP
jgi:hypothetical protein